MVTEKAMELGQALVESAEFKEYEEARIAMEADLTAVNLLSAYTGKEKELTTAMTTTPPDGDRINELSEQLEILRKKAVTNDKIAELSRTQVAFTAMMSTVNSIITSYINPNAGNDGCSGDCSGCAGCQ